MSDTSIREVNRFYTNILFFLYKKTSCLIVVWFALLDQSHYPWFYGEKKTVSREKQVCLIHISRKFDLISKSWFILPLIRTQFGSWGTFVKENMCIKVPSKKGVTKKKTFYRFHVFFLLGVKSLNYVKCTRVEWFYYQTSTCSELKKQQIDYIHIEYSQCC
jgi:hypothetical protein